MGRGWACVIAGLALAGCSAPSVGRGDSDATDLQGNDEEAETSVALWLADRDASAVLRVSALDGRIEILADALEMGPLLLGEPSSVRRGPDDALYVTTYSPSGVTRLEGGEASTFFTDSYLEEPVELAFRGDELFVLGNDTGNVVVADGGGSFVRELGYPEMRNAHDMAFGPDGWLYVATSYNIGLEGGVQKWDVDTAELVGVFAGEDEVGRATGLAFADGGWLYVADSMHGTVVRFDADAGAFDAVVVEGLDQPVSLVIVHDDLFVADRSGVHRYDARSGDVLGEIASPEHVERVRGVTAATAPSR
ncbi:MAG: hypothetical protein RIF41_04895 [Polyangiaceae bacterium]